MNRVDWSIANILKANVTDVLLNFEKINLNNFICCTFLLCTVWCLVDNKLFFSTIKPYLPGRNPYLIYFVNQYHLSRRLATNEEMNCNSTESNITNPVSNISFLFLQSACKLASVYTLMHWPIVNHTVIICWFGNKTMVHC